MDGPVCAIVGAGPGNGAAFARKFAREGYRLALMSRSGEEAGKLENELWAARFFPCDVAEPRSAQAAFDAVRREMGDVDTLIYNAGSGIWGNVEEVSAEDFEQCWRVNALGAFIALRQVIPAMKKKGHGNIVFVGATASRRGNIATAAFAPAKAAQRSLAESMAKHLGPCGVHVSLVIIDGVVNSPSTRGMFRDKPEDFFLQPEDIADAVMHLVRQKPSAWSFEIDLRPFGERW